jgi:hypothetical protein
VPYCGLKNIRRHRIKFIYMVDIRFLICAPLDYRIFKAVRWLRWLADGVLPRRHGFDLLPVHVGFVAGKVALGQVLPLVLRCYPVHFITPLLHDTKNENK